MSGDVVIPLGIYALFIVAAIAGAGLGYVLSGASRQDRRLALILGLVAAVVSPILHSLAPAVWAALLGALAGYARGRFSRRTERRKDIL